MDSSLSTNQMNTADDASTINQNTDMTTTLTTTAAVPAAKMTPEQEEEMKLRVKYPNPQKPGGSAFIQKMLHKGNKKYFDSGDYNMAKSRIKNLNANKSPNAAVETTPAGQGATSPSAMAVESSSNLNTIKETTFLTSTSTEFSSPTIVVMAEPPTPLITSTPPNCPADASMDSSAPYITAATTPTLVTQRSSHPPEPVTPQIFLNTLGPGPSGGGGGRLTISQSYSTSNLSSSNNLLSAHHATPTTMTSSNSTNSLSMLSSSISSDKLYSLQLNSNVATMLDTDEIGLAIPTPEMLPQSRKHSIVQSKLVTTPKLSSS